MIYRRALTREMGLATGAVLTVLPGPGQGGNGTEVQAASAKVSNRGRAGPDRPKQRAGWLSREGAVMVILRGWAGNG